MNILSVNESLSLIAIVEAVDLAEAKSRIPSQYKGLSYFGANDEWQFIATNKGSTSPKPCEDCLSYEGNYFGDEIRGLFPDLIVVDENKIYANIHPNCGCVLARLGYGELTEQ